MKKEIKKIHKRIVREMRAANKHLMTDDYLGKNRFRIDMYSEKYYRYSDNSGYQINIIFKITDNKTGNKAFFLADNYNYSREIALHLTDFMIRCSTGMKGHYPPLAYVAYDVHEIVPYEGASQNVAINDEAIDMYDYLTN